MDIIFKTLDKLSISVDWLVTRLVFVLMVGLVITTTLQIIFRVFFDALIWSEELSRYLLVWITFFAATMAYKRGTHIVINFAVNNLKAKIKIWFTTFQYLISMIFFGVLLYYNWQMIQLQIFQISPAMSLPMQYVYFGITASMGIMLIHALAGLSMEFSSYVQKQVKK